MVVVVVVDRDVPGNDARVEDVEHEPAEGGVHPAHGGGI